MSPLHQISYEEFGKLRFLDFFPRTKDYREDHDGGMETGIGMACTEGYLSTMFTSPMDQEWETVEMLLEFADDCPEAHGHALLDALGIKLRKTMNTAQVKEILGVTENDEPTWLRFVIGKEFPYLVGCLV